MKINPSLRAKTQVWNPGKPEKNRVSGFGFGCLSPPETTFTKITLGDNLESTESTKEEPTTELPTSITSSTFVTILPSTISLPLTKTTSSPTTTSSSTGITSPPETTFTINSGYFF